MDNKISTFISGITSNKFTISLIFVSFLAGTILGFYVTHGYYEPKLEKVQTQLTDYQSKYSSIELEKQEALVAKATAEAQSGKTVYIPGEVRTEIQTKYVEKETPNSPDAKITVNPPVFSYEFNGKSYASQMQTKNGSATKADGQFVFTQDSTLKLNIDDVVNREIALVNAKKDKEIAVQKREKEQQTFWGTVGGFALGRLTSSKR